MRAICIAHVLLLPSLAGAWERGGLPWTMPDEGVPYCLEVRASDAATPAEKLAFRDAVDAAIASWRADCSGFCARLEACGTPPTWPGDWHDGANWIVWLADWESLPIGSNTVGATAIWRSNDGTPLDADTFLNDETFTWSVDGDAWAIDVESVVTHEIGHALGLAHYDETDPNKRLACLDDTAPYPSVMCSQLGHGAIRRRPTDDDLEGLCALYPSGGVSICAALDGGDPPADPSEPPAGACSTCPPSLAPICLLLLARRRQRR